MKKFLAIYLTLIPLTVLADNQVNDSNAHTLAYFFGDSLTDSHTTNNLSPFEVDDWRGNNAWGTTDETGKVGAPYTSAESDYNSNYRPMYPNYLVSEFGVLNNSIFPIRIAKDLGINPQEVSINYAYSGAESIDGYTIDDNPVISKALSVAVCNEPGLIGESAEAMICVPGLLKQVQLYLEDMPGNQASPEALYFLWAGGNDIKNNFSLIKTKAAANNVVTAVNLLLNAGAKENNIVVLNMPDMGTVPAANGIPMISMLFTLHSNHYNDALNDGLEAYPDVVLISAFDELGRIVGSGDYTNTTDACTTVNIALPECYDYVWWDGIHPTNDVHKELARLISTQLSN